MPFSWFVALRYLREGRMQTALILGAVSIGVAVVVFLSALIGGLQTSLIAKTLGSQAHIVVRPRDREARVITAPRPEETFVRTIEKPSQRLPSISGWQGVIADIARVPGVTATSPTVSGGAFAIRGAATRPVAVRGIDPERAIAILGLDRKMKEGRYRIVGAEVLVGTDLAAFFGIGVGDKLRLVTATGEADVLTIAGTFDLGSKDINERLIFVPLRAAQTLFDLAGGVSSIDVQVSDLFGAEAVAAALEKRTGLLAESWTTTNAQLLVALQSQGGSKNVILLFVTITVALGIASVLIVSVVQKSREIGVMRAVGTSRARVMRIFLIQGGLFGFAGSLLGAGLGALLAAGFVRVFRAADGTPMFPIEVTWRLVIGPMLLATVVGLLAAVAPAWRASRLDPAEAIRHG